MRKTDRNRDEFVKKIFDKDPADPLYYDVVINTDKIPLKEAADIVVTLARHAFFK
jgi:cytidylate kinase